MAEDTRTKLAKVREAATGLKRVEYSTNTGSQKKEEEVAAYEKPIYLQEPDYKEVKGAILVYDSTGKQLIKPFYNLIISSTQYGIGERVSRTAVMDGEVRKFLGKAPLRVAFSIGLLDYKNHPWKDQFIYLWNEVLRGSVLQEIGAKVYIYCGGDIFVGDLHSCQFGRAATDGSADGVVMASMQMDCDKSPIPYNPALAGITTTEENAISLDIQKTIETGMGIKKVFWD